jgi:DNA polymerase III alpha subunit
LGLAKFDILSQRGLAKIKETVDILATNRAIDIDIHQVTKFKEDQRVKDLLKEGKCIGCFYIESPAMRMLLTKLQADDYLRLVAASSIIRPGVSKSGMMNEYIQRYRDPIKREKAQKAIPHLYEILEETYGVMVYQEDVIKVAHYFAGLSLADADYLRRGMSWKFKQRNEFHKVKENFFQNCNTKRLFSKNYTRYLVPDREFC